MDEFVRLYRETLQAQRPQLYRTLEARGELDRHLAEQAERAFSQFQTTLAHLRRQDPGPREYLPSLHHLQGLLSQAREVAAEDLLSPLADPDEAVDA